MADGSDQMPNPKCRRRILDDEGTETEWTILEIKFLEISTDGTFYAECITWLCHPKQAVEVYGICMVRCPACKGRICDIIATAGGRVVLKVKCPECGRIVKLEWLLQVTETAK